MFPVRHIYNRSDKNGYRIWEWFNFIDFALGESIVKPTRISNPCSLCALRGKAITVLAAGAVMAEPGPPLHLA